MADAEDRGGDVIELRPGVDLDDEQRMLHLKRVDHAERRCVQHGPYELDNETQRVYCRVCKGEVPAFVVLKHFARESERYISARKEFARRADVAREQLELLEQSERNAKARLRRLRAQGATVEFDELTAASSRSYSLIEGRTVLYVASEDMIAEVRLVAPGMPCRVDSLMSPWSWRIGAYDEEVPHGELA